MCRSLGMGVGGGARCRGSRSSRGRAVGPSWVVVVGVSWRVRVRIVMVVDLRVVRTQTDSAAVQRVSCNHFSPAHILAAAHQHSDISPSAQCHIVVDLMNYRRHRSTCFPMGGGSLVMSWSWLARRP